MVENHECEVVFVPFKKTKRTLWERIAENVKDSLNGLGIIIRENGTLKELYPFGAVVFVLIVVLTRIISGEWFRIAEFLIVGVLSYRMLVIETLNTAIEELADKVEPGEDEKIRRTKDVASAAVCLYLFATFAATVFFAVCHLVHFRWWEFLF